MDSPDLAVTPEPPYKVVVFTSRLRPDHPGYHEAAQRMLELVQNTPGFLGVDSARGDDLVGITVAYFSDDEAILTWRDQPEHATTRDAGRAHWYEAFEVRVGTVERAYGFSR